MEGVRFQNKLKLGLARRHFVLDLLFTSRDRHRQEKKGKIRSPNRWWGAQRGGLPLTSSSFYHLSFRNTFHLAKCHDSQNNSLNVYTSF